MGSNTVDYQNPLKRQSFQFLSKLLILLQLFKCILLMCNDKFYREILTEVQFIRRCKRFPENTTCFCDHCAFSTTKVWKYLFLCLICIWNISLNTSCTYGYKHKGLNVTYLAKFNQFAESYGSAYRFSNHCVNYFFLVMKENKTARTVKHLQ